MPSEPLVLVSFHIFKFSYHNLRPNYLVGVLYRHAPSAASRFSVPLHHPGLNHRPLFIANSLLVELDKVLEFNVIM